MSEQRQTQAVGIASLGLQLPPLAMDLEELAQLRGTDPNKYKLGLGCHQMALCPQGYTVVDLAVGAAKRALSRWDGDIESIGLLAVGTESALDMSRPLSSWVAAELGLRGNFRSYEVKHACYGGTLALRQAVEWKRAQAAPGKAALVIASDIALYAEGDPGEPTQGAGAVAMIIDDDRVAGVSPLSYAFSEPAFDFWRPVGCAFPLVEGPLSLECYQRATAACFSQLIGPEQAGALGRLDRFEALCFHVPFPKMVKKAMGTLGETFALGEAEAAELFKRRVEPTLAWNRKIGNAYTAALWVSVADQLSRTPQGSEIAAFSYGSGFGSELFTLTAGPACDAAAWVKDIESDLQTRRMISADEYVRLRAGERRLTPSVPPAASVA